jgi:hypothetical protein
MYTLMIKTHNITGLKYLCKCSRKNYLSYKGSGKYWKRHLKKHGNDISTEVLFQTNDLEEFKKICCEMSLTLNVVESDDWANLIDETGEDGGVTHTNPYWLKDYKHSNETKLKIGEASKKMWKDGKGKPSFLGKSHTDESRLKMSLASKGISKSHEHIEAMKKAAKNRPPRILDDEIKNKFSTNMSNMLIVMFKCNICNKSGNYGTIARYHKNCILNPNFKFIETSERATDIIECECINCKNIFMKKRKEKRNTCSKKCASILSWVKRNDLTKQ